MLVSLFIIKVKVKRLGLFNHLLVFDDIYMMLRTTFSLFYIFLFHIKVCAAVGDFCGILKKYFFVLSFTVIFLSITQNEICGLM